MSRVLGGAQITSLSASYEDNNDQFIANFRAMCARGGHQNHLVGHAVVLDSWGYYDTYDVLYGLESKLIAHYTGARFNDTRRLKNVSRFYRSNYTNDVFWNQSGVLNVNNIWKGDIQTGAYVNNEQPSPNPTGATGSSTTPFFNNKATEWGLGRQCIKCGQSDKASMIYAEGGPTSIGYDSIKRTTGVLMGPAILLDLIFTSQKSASGAFDYAIYQNSTNGTTYDGRTITSDTGTSVTTSACNTQITAVKADIQAGTHSNASATLAAGTGATDVVVYGSINQATFASWNGTSWSTGVSNEISPSTHTGWLNAASGKALNQNLPYVIVIFSRKNNTIVGIEGVLTGVDELGPYASPYQTTGAHVAYGFSSPGAHCARFRDYTRPVMQMGTHLPNPVARTVVPLSAYRKMASRKAVGNLTADFSHTCVKHFITIGPQNDANSGEVDASTPTIVLTGILSQHIQDLTDFATFIAAGYTDENGNQQPFFWTHIQIPYLGADWRDGTTPYDTRGTFAQWESAWDQAIAAVPGAQKSCRRINLRKAMQSKLWSESVAKLGFAFGNNHMSDAGVEWIVRLIQDADSRASLSGITLI